MRRWVGGGHVQPTLPFATAEHKADFMDRLGGEGGFVAPNCWYRSFTEGAQNESEEMVAEEDKIAKVPTLYWGGEGDLVCRPAALQPTINAGLLPRVTKVTREGAIGRCWKSRLCLARTLWAGCRRPTVDGRHDASRRARRSPWYRCGKG